MKKIRFLHVARDDKFFRPVLNAYSRYDVIESKNILYHRSKESLSCIREDDDVDVYSNAKAFVARLNQSDYDVLYLHSLQPSFYRFVKHIPKDKIVIWWAYGYDIYGQQILGMDSFINIDVFKEKTKALRSQVPLAMKLKRLYARIFIAPKFEKVRKQIIKRVDYFQPVCDIDYELMKKCAGLQAEVFYSPVFSNFSTGKETAKVMRANGSILIGNSAEYVQNHLDAWDAVKPYIPKEREVVVPLSYGDKYYGEQVKKELTRDDYNINILDTFLPIDEYFKIFERCSYAIFGTIRQHAMGNIYNALLKGLKVFLYKDSYVYKYFKDIGCVVFALEEIDGNSFSEPLPEEYQTRNIVALKKEQESCHNLGVQRLKEIACRINGE